jgi:Niemann-Pick C1 protein
MQVRWLCLYAFPTILVDFLYQVTFFVALIVLDEKRMKNARRDCLLCCVTKNPVEYSSRNDEAATPQLLEKGMIWYVDVLLRPWVKACVMAICAALLVVCALAATRLKLEFDFTSVLLSDSYVISFTNALNEHTQRRISADLYFSNVDQADASVQDEMEALRGCAGRH